MVKTDEIIAIPRSPTASTSSERSAPPTSASSDSDLSDGPLESLRDKRSLLRQQSRQIQDRFKRCREKTLESELCRTISRSLRSCMSDDQSRRVIAIAIIILACIGLWHVLTAIL